MLILLRGLSLNIVGRFRWERRSIRFFLLGLVHNLYSTSWKSPIFMFLYPIKNNFSQLRLQPISQPINTQSKFHLQSTIHRNNNINSSHSHIRICMFKTRHQQVIKNLFPIPFSRINA